MKNYILNFVIVSLLTSLSLSVFSQCEFTHRMYRTPISCDNNLYMLIFEDNFDGDSLDENIWEIHEGVTNGYDDTKDDFPAHKEWSQRENIVVENGLLKIVTKREFKPNMPFIANWDPYHVVYSDFEFTSGSIQTKARFPIEGKFEARIKLPNTKGLWPAFWLYSEYIGDVYDELDIFEFYNYSNRVPHFNTNSFYANHGGYAEAINCSDNHWNVVKKYPITSEFCTYTVIWDKDKIEWYINGRLLRKEPLYFTTFLWGWFGNCSFNGHYCNEIKANKKYRSIKYLPLDPMHILLNTAVMVKKDEKPINSNTFPAQMEVDYVRVYQRKPCKQDVYVSNNINNQYYFGGTKTFYRNFTGRNIDLNCNMNVPINYQVKITAQNSIVFNNGFSLNIGDSTLFLASTQSDLCSSLSLKRIFIENITIYEGEEEPVDTTSNVKDLYAGVKPLLVYPSINNDDNIFIDFQDNSFRDITLLITDISNQVLYSNNNIENSLHSINCKDYDIGEYVLKIMNVKMNESETYLINIIE